MLAIGSYTLQQTRREYAAARPRLLDELRGVIRRRNYSIRPEIAYVDWVRRFVHFCELRHPRDCGAAEVEAFLTHLAVDGRVTGSTQNQARSALLFLYKEVLDVQLPWLDGVVTAKRPARLPIVLTVNEVQRLLERSEGAHRLVLRLLYGTGMRVLEALRLRVKDIDFERHEIIVREGKGLKDRVTMLPLALVDDLRRQLDRTKRIHAIDLEGGYGEVYLPFALARKYPRAGR